MVCILWVEESSSGPSAENVVRDLAQICSNLMRNDNFWAARTAHVHKGSAPVQMMPALDRTICGNRCIGPLMMNNSRIDRRIVVAAAAATVQTGKKASTGETMGYECKMDIRSRCASSALERRTVIGGKR